MKKLSLKSEFMPTKLQFRFPQPPSVAGGGLREGVDSRQRCRRSRRPILIKPRMPKQCKSAPSTANRGGRRAGRGWILVTVADAGGIHIYPEIWISQRLQPTDRHPIPTTPSSWQGCENHLPQPPIVAGGGWGGGGFISPLPSQTASIFIRKAGSANAYSQRIDIQF